MPLFTANFVTNLPNGFGLSSRTNCNSIPNYAGFRCFFFFFFPSTHFRNSSPNFPFRISSTSKLNRSCCSVSSSSSSIMEGHKHVGPLISGSESLSQELKVAVGAVQMACFLCQRLQMNLLKSNAQIQAKDDNSPVTVAGISFVFFFFFGIYLFNYCDICIY